MSYLLSKKAQINQTVSDYNDTVADAQKNPALAVQNPLQHQVSDLGQLAADFANLRNVAADASRTAALAQDTQNDWNRNAEIRRVVEARALSDTRIMSKVNQVNREAFVLKYPGQCQHILRLIAERLQITLSKPPGTDLADSDTWLGTPEDLAHLAQALYYMHLVSQDMASPTE